MASPKAASTLELSGDNEGIFKVRVNKKGSVRQVEGIAIYTA